MPTPTSILCPVDFSDSSRGAVRYAAAIARHFDARMTVMTVDDPFVARAVAASIGPEALATETMQTLASFVTEALAAGSPGLDVTYVVRVGRTAPEILRLAADADARAIVMSTRGISGIRRAVFGSTTERVLRETRVPVFVTEGTDPGPPKLDDLKRALTNVLVPLDFAGSEGRQVAIARALAADLGARLVLAHVVEPSITRSPYDHLRTATRLERLDIARQRLEHLLKTVAPRDATAACGYGDPASEIARLAIAHQAGVIVTFLHNSLDPDRRIGTVTYRLLCETLALVVACPPDCSADVLAVARAVRTSASEAGSAGPRR